MAQVFDPVPSDHPSRILCCYINATSKIQIARITNIENWYFERVVFPGQRLIFEALASALLEIHSGAMASAILSDTIPCSRLRMGGSENDPVEDGQSAADSGQANGLNAPSGSVDALTTLRNNLPTATSTVLESSLHYQPV
ncbi:MAG: DUF1830 domain-containing protein [Cyanobacteria bacterium P01_A01_bin.135]